MRKFKILAIDGGGLRGVVPLTILKHIEQVTGKRIHESFDLIAGTSTGGLLSCAIALKDPNNPGQPLYTLDQIMEVYLKRGKEIFPPRNWLGRQWGKVSDLFTPKYGTRGIDKVFRDVVKNHRLTDVLTDVIVSTYDLTNNVPLFFKSRLARKYPDQNATLYDICRATSAGPTYLPSYPFSYPQDDQNPNRNCIDGGVFVNNPSMAALADYSRALHTYRPEAPPNADVDYNNVFVLSLGTGSYTDKISNAESTTKGKLFWANHISDVMMRGVNRTTDYAMGEMMETGNYLRLSMTIESEERSAMDNADSGNMHYLISETKRQVLENEGRMKQLKELLAKMEEPEVPPLNS